ncbi:unnamed protein product [Hymenolepis diminuta]|uniref:ShKT domain-containing protein n=1 Tax=Hymenolepis diminuta TaxID=6216 RepID=A0A0R3SQU2_HYMDI|nr:unnamed protein product [Hymenolepis diminuta]
MFFVPNGTKKFNFRSGCATRYGCPSGYKNLMCTDFIRGVKTCRLCCFESKCHDPTPASETRVKVMKDLLFKTGLDAETVEKYVEKENEIAFYRGVARATTAAYKTEREGENEKSTTVEEEVITEEERTQVKLAQTTSRSQTEVTEEETLDSTSEPSSLSTEEIDGSYPSTLDEEYNISELPIQNGEESSDSVDETEEHDSSMVDEDNNSVDSSRENVSATMNEGQDFVKSAEEKSKRPITEEKSTLETGVDSSKRNMKENEDYGEEKDEMIHYGKEFLHESSENAAESKDYLQTSGKEARTMFDNEKVEKTVKEPQMNDQAVDELPKTASGAMNFKKYGNLAIRIASGIAVPFLSAFLLLYMSI